MGMTYLWLFLILPAWFLWTVAHEGAHVLAAKVEGYKILSFKPWPHKTEGDGWVWGRMTYQGAATTKIHLAPYWVDLAAFVAVYPILWLVPPAPEGVITLLVALSRPIVNTFVGVLGRYRGVSETDLARVHWGWATVFLAAIVVYAAGVGLWVGAVI